VTENELRSFLSGKLIEMAEQILLYYDCCELRGAHCRGGDPNPCCVNSIFGPGLCPHWRYDQCGNVNPDCRLWICDSAASASNPVGVRALRLLEEFGLLFGLTNRPLIGETYFGADRQSRRE
jgi:hypothetical protein